MSSETRYHSSVSRWCAASSVLLAILLVPTLQAQIKTGGLPPSVTSIGFSPNPVAPGIPPSVTSLGFGQQVPPFPISNRPFFRGHAHHHHFPGYGGLPIYSMPYYYPPVILEPIDDTMEQDYSPGPTIFDRHSSSRSGTAVEQQFDDRLDRLEQLIDEAEAKTQPAAPEPAEEPKYAAADQPQTVLVFRDGHSIEVKNYAIVGDVLYDFSTDRRHKIALADLDLAATQKQNEDRGIDFHLPTRTGN